MAVALVAAVVAATAGAAPPGIAVTTTTVELAGRDGDVDVYVPRDGTPSEVAIVAHGFARTRHRHSDLGRALAEAGVAAVVPDLPFVLDLWGNGEAIVELVGRIEQGALGLPPVPRTRIVLMGTSAGGLATVVAAAKLETVAGWIGLDPVDRTGTGARAAEQVKAPAIVLLADSSPCNLFGSGRAIADALPQLVRRTKFDGASHCDFESPSNNFCRAVCGTSVADTDAKIRDETVAATLELLRRETR
ncbi:MAG: hypothetical protein U1F15_02025 [Burkholderiales bacterium]